MSSTTQLPRKLISSEPSKENSKSSLRQKLHRSIRGLIVCWMCLGLALVFIPANGENIDHAEEDKVEVKIEPSGELVDLNR